MSSIDLLIKSAHMLGVVIFLGNIIVSAWWKYNADKSENPAIIAFAQQQVTLTDNILMRGGAILISVTGIASIVMHDMDFFTPWLLWGIGLFALSGIIWAVLLVPLRNKMTKMAVKFAEDGIIPESYWQLQRRWIVYGLLTALPLLPALIVMIAQPV